MISIATQDELEVVAKRLDALTEYLGLQEIYSPDVLHGMKITYVKKDEAKEG